MNVGFFGQQGVPDAMSRFNVTDFHIKQALLRARTATLVLVKGVHGGGLGAVPPTVDVLPLVNMVDAVGNQVGHGIVYGIPAVRLQGGLNAIILDPAIDDVGLLVVCDRDVSSVKANKGAQSNPGSFDHHSLADGIYIGGILNFDAPNQAVQFADDGVHIFDRFGHRIDMTSSGIAITGNLTVSGDVTAGAGGSDSVGLQTHQHPTAATGSPSSPTPGT